MSAIPENISAGIFEHYLKKHTGKMYVPVNVKKVLEENNLQGILKEAQISKKDALKAITALQRAGVVHKYRTPSEVLKKAIKSYGNGAGVVTDQRAGFEKRKKQRQEEMLARLNLGEKDGTAGDVRQKRRDVDMIIKRKQMIKKGMVKEFLEEQRELERKKKARQEKEESGQNISDNDRQNEASMRMDF